MVSAKTIILKSTIHLLVPIVLISFALIPNADALPFNYADGTVSIKITPSSDKCYPGDGVTLALRVEAMEDLMGLVINVRLHGLKSQGSEEWTENIPILSLPEGMSAGATLDDTIQITVPDYTSPGLIYGMVNIQHSSIRLGIISTTTDFLVVYVKNRDYEQLQINYNKMKSQYQVLGELGNARNLMYIFLVMTIVFLASTIYFARKSRRIRKTRISS